MGQQVKVYRSLEFYPNGGATASAKIYPSSTGIAFGVDDTGYDLQLFGATTGNYLLWDESADDLLLVGTATQLAVAGTTESTSTTTGSLRTAGGLACGGDFYAGDDIFLTTGAVLNFNAGNVTVTHAAGKLTVAVPAPTGSIDSFTVNMTSGSATPGTIRGIVGAATTYTTQSSGNTVGVRGSVTMGGNCSGTAYLYGVQGKAITGANTWTGTALAGVYGQIDVSGGTISSGHVAAIQANVYGANSGTIPMEGIYVEHAGGGVINSLIQVFGKSTYVFDIASNTHNNVSTTGTCTTPGQAHGWIKCNIDGATRYIALSEAVS